MAVLLGGAIGLEREISGKPAGLRTNILICVGSALLTDVSMHIGVVNGARWGDPARLAAQIVSGVGFIGAGTIMQSKGKISGLTSAATIWVVAAIGIAVGAGLYFEAAGAGALVAIVLGGLGKLEHRARRARRNVQMVVRARPDASSEELFSLIESQGIKIVSSDVYSHRDDRVLELRLAGPARQYDVVRQMLGKRADVYSTHLY